MSIHYEQDKRQSGRGGEPWPVGAMTVQQGDDEDAADVVEAGQRGHEDDERAADHAEEQVRPARSRKAKNTIADVASGPDT
jgi:hypothetical protein